MLDLVLQLTLSPAGFAAWKKAVAMQAAVRTEAVVATGRGRVAEAALDLSPLDGLFAIPSAQPSVAPTLVDLLHLAAPSLQTAAAVIEGLLQGVAALVGATEIGKAGSKGFYWRHPSASYVTQGLSRSHRFAVSLAQLSFEEGIANPTVEVSAALQVDGLSRFLEVRPIAFVATALCWLDRKIGNSAGPP